MQLVGWRGGHDYKFQHQVPLWAGCSVLPHSKAGAGHSPSVAQRPDTAESVPQYLGYSFGVPPSSFARTNSLQPFLHMMLPFAAMPVLLNKGTFLHICRKMRTSVYIRCSFTIIIFYLCYCCLICYNVK